MRWTHEHINLVTYWIGQTVPAFVACFLVFARTTEIMLHALGAAAVVGPLLAAVSTASLIEFRPDRSKQGVNADHKDTAAFAMNVGLTSLVIGITVQCGQIGLYFVALYVLTPAFTNGVIPLCVALTLYLLGGPLLAATVLRHFKRARY